MTTRRIRPLMRITMRVLQIMTSSLAGERPPPTLLILNPASAHCPIAFLTVKATFEVRFFSFLKPPKEVGVNRNLLILWDISFQGKLRWMTGTPASPAEPVIGPKTQRWVDRDLKGLIRCCVGAIPSCRLLESLRDFLNGLNRQNTRAVVFFTTNLMTENKDVITQPAKKILFLYQLSNFCTLGVNINGCHYAVMRKIIKSSHS